MRASNLTPWGIGFNPGVCFTSSRRRLAAHRRRRNHLSILALAFALGGCAGTPADCVRVVSWADFRELALEQEVIDSLAVRHPEIPVCLESLEGAGIYREKILTSIAAGTPPGVFLLDGIDAPAFIESGVLLDLAPYMTRVGLDIAAFHPRLTELFAPSPHLWAVPKGFTPMVIYYNRSVFDSARVPYPQPGWTWDDFRATARALKTLAPRSAISSIASQSISGRWRASRTLLGSAL